MEAKHACAVVAAVCLLGFVTSENEKSFDSTQLEVGRGDFQHRLEDKVEAVSDLDDEARSLKKQRAKERQVKAQAAVTYVEKYKAKKTGLRTEQARLRQRLANDKMVLMNGNPALKKAHERAQKHDSRVKRNMKNAVLAMKKVSKLVDGKIKTDPTVKNAQKAVAKVRGKEVYSVLGLDKAQLGKASLMGLDAAVAAYDAEPSHSAHQKLERALLNAKERMTKDQKLERKKKSEKRAKKERTAKNKQYYKVKWVEKTRELKRKRIKRDNFVAKLKKEGKNKAWVRRKNEDEIEAKTRQKQQIVAKRKNKIRVAQERHAKVVKAKYKIKKNYFAKLNTKLKKLQDISSAKRSDYHKKTIELKRAVTHMVAAKLSMEKKAKAVSVASKMKASAAKAYGQSKEKKTKAPSELNVKTAEKASFYMRAKATTSRETKYKAKASKATMKEREKKKATAKLAKRAAFARQNSAIKAAANFKAVIQIKKNKISRGKSPKRISRRIARRRRI